MNASESSEEQSSTDAFLRLQHIIRRLRGEGGCPWDSKQTPLSLKKYLLEECQELAEAIDGGREEEICDEIGDLFFVLTLLMAMYAERQQFTVDDVLEQIIAKMIRRHPHVFADVTLTDEDELRLQWERIKAQEKQLATPSRP